jgi:hypothetical protein
VWRGGDGALAMANCSRMMRDVGQRQLTARAKLGRRDNNCSVLDFRRVGERRNSLLEE